MGPSSDHCLTDNTGRAMCIQVGYNLAMYSSQQLRRMIGLSPCAAPLRTEVSTILSLRPEPFFPLALEFDF